MCAGSLPAPKAGDGWIMRYIMVRPARLDMRVVLNPSWLNIKARAGQLSAMVGWAWSREWGTVALDTRVACSWAEL